MALQRPGEIQPCNYCMYVVPRRDGENGVRLNQLVQLLPPNPIGSKTQTKYPTLSVSLGMLGLPLWN